MMNDEGKEVSEDIVSLGLIIVHSLVGEALRSRDRNEQPLFLGAFVIIRILDQRFVYE